MSNEPQCQPLTDKEIHDRKVELFWQWIRHFKKQLESRGRNV